MTRLSRFVSCLVFAALCAVSAPALAQFNAFKDPTAGASAGGASGPDLKAAVDKVDGGKITVGANAYVVATFKNNGTSPVNVTGINLYPSSTVSAQVSLNKCSEGPLPPEAQCAVTVVVTGLAVGTFRVEILLDHDGRSRLAEAALTGSVEGAGTQSNDQVRSDIEAVPDALDFGAASGGIPLFRSILLRNRTSDKVNLTGIKLDSPQQSGFTYKSSCPDTLSPSESCVLTVTWTPTAPGMAQGVLTVLHSAKSALTKVDITGTFSPTSAATATLYPSSVADMGILVADKDKVDFGTGIDSISAMTVSLVNAGAADVTLKTIGLAGSDNGLSISRSGCHVGTVLRPVDACALTINWVPSRAGSVIDDLQISHTGARGILILPIRGAAAAAASRESMAVNNPSMDLQGGSGRNKSSSKESKTDKETDADVAKAEKDMLREAPPALTLVLDGYTVTSHSPSKAIIDGPVGSLVVRDGEDVVISGARWTVTIVPTGVVLTSENDEIMLLFDKSLRPAGGSSKATSSSTSSASEAAAPAAAAPAAALSPAAALTTALGGG